MSEAWYYKSLHKVKVVTKSEGYWIIEALEEFEDSLDGEKIKVKIGDQRIVPSEMVHKRISLPPPIKEHIYSLQMEKKFKKLGAKKEKQCKEE